MVANPCRIASTVHDCMNENGLPADGIEDGKRESLGQKAMITLVSLAVDAAIKAERLDVSVKIG